MSEEENRPAARPRRRVPSDAENPTPDTPETPTPRRRAAPPPPAGETPQRRAAPPPDVEGASPSPRQAPSPEQHRPAMPSRQVTRPSIQTDNVMAQVNQVLSTVGLDLETALKVLVLAAAAAILSALLDAILGLPTQTLLFAFGQVVTVLVGASYAIIRGKTDLGGVIMAVLAGVITLEIYFILMEIIGGDFPWTYYMNVFKAFIMGVILGLVGFGWVALLRAIPADLLGRVKRG